jgi:hypothetical protein
MMENDPYGWRAGVCQPVFAFHEHVTMWSVVIDWLRKSAVSEAGTGRGLRLGVIVILSADNSANFGTPLVLVSEGAVLVTVRITPALVRVVEVSIGTADGAIAFKATKEGIYEGSSEVSR